MLINKLLIVLKRNCPKALSLIHEEETIFLGPGTTIELLAEAMEFKHLRVVTNCLPVFETLSKKNALTIYLVGGEMRLLTKSFWRNR